MKKPFQTSQRKKEISATIKAEEEKGKRNVKHKQSEFCPTGPCAIGREGHYDAAAILAERK